MMLLVVLILNFIVELRFQPIQYSVSNQGRYEMNSSVKIKSANEKDTAKENPLCRRARAHFRKMLGEKNCLQR